MSTENNKQDTGEISINFGEIFKSLKNNSLLILITSVFFATIGGIYSFTLDNEYESISKVLPESTSNAGLSGNLGSLSSLAGLAGINLGNGQNNGDLLTPGIYPNIVQSSPFLRELIIQKLYNPKTKSWGTVKEYLNQDNSNAPFQFFKEKKSEKITDIVKPMQGRSTDLLALSPAEANALGQLKTTIKIEPDKKSPAILISAKFNDPLVAANMTSLIQNQLTKYIINYRTEKSRKELQFLQERQSDARKRYDLALFTLSNYKDQNRNVFKFVARDQEKKLQYEVDLAFNIYSTLSSQLTEAKIKVQKDTPVFKTLEPAQVNESKVNPNRTLITLGALFFGLFISLIYVFFKSINLKELLS
jgi:uncharacterized protein involved in exopolysaccharide biosynthesis